MTLAYAGCRLSEALALTVNRVDLAAGVLMIEGAEIDDGQEIADLAEVDHQRCLAL